PRRRWSAGWPGPPGSHQGEAAFGGSTLLPPAGTSSARVLTRSGNDICDRDHVWSLHRSGANFLMADGAVRFFPYSTEPMVLALASRSGGESHGRGRNPNSPPPRSEPHGGDATRTGSGRRRWIRARAAKRRGASRPGA